MGLLNKFFKSKEKGFFQNIRDEIASQEKKKILLKSPFIKDQQLELNTDNLLSFVMAAFCFEHDSKHLGSLTIETGVYRIDKY